MKRETKVLLFFPTIALVWFALVSKILASPPERSVIVAVVVLLWLASIATIEGFKPSPLVWGIGLGILITDSVKLDIFLPKFGFLNFLVFGTFSTISLLLFPTKEK